MLIEKHVVKTIPMQAVETSPMKKNSAPNFSHFMSTYSEGKRMIKQIIQCVTNITNTPPTLTFTWFALYFVYQRRMEAINYY